MRWYMYYRAYVSPGPKRTHPKRSLMYIVGLPRGTTWKHRKDMEELSALDPVQHDADVLQRTITFATPRHIDARLWDAHPTSHASGC